MTEPSPCPNYEKVEGCPCRHCAGICLCRREAIATRLVREHGQTLRDLGDES